MFFYLIIAVFSLCNSSATTKRSTENHPSPDSKRAKVSQTPSELSPNIPNSSPASISSAEPAPNKLSQPPNRFNQTILQRFREVDAEWKKLKKNYDEAVAQNRVEAAQIKKERDNKQAELDQLKQAISTVIQSQPQHTRSNSQGQPQATNMAAPSTTQAPPQPPQVPSTKGDIPRGPDPQALIQLMHSRTAAHHNAPPGTPGFGVPPNITPEMASQMQKLVENRGIRPPQASFPQAQPAQQNPSLSMAVPAPTPLQPVPRAPTFFWEGSLSWTGFDVTTRDRKEMRAEVKVASAADMYVLFCIVLNFFTHLSMKYVCDVAIQFDTDAFEGTCRIGTRSTDLGQAHQGPRVHNAGAF